MLDESFTEEAQRVLGRALNEMAAFDHAFLGTEHILVGLVGEESSASSVLNEMGISLEAARERLEIMLGRGSHGVPNEDVPLTQAAKRALALAVREARADGYVRAEPIHLLRGILRQRLLRQPFDDEIYGWCAATLILRELGVIDFRGAYA